MQALWRFAPPPGWAVTARDGALRPIAGADAEGERAQRVVEELSRLRGQGELKDSALLRSNEQLDQLELELDDHLVQLQVAGSAQAAEIRGQLGQLRDDRQRNAAVYGERAGNRKALGIGRRTREWSAAAAEGTAAVVTLPGDLPWREALALEPRTSLGDGGQAPGHRAAGERTLLGIDLVGDAAAGLTLRGSGGDLDLELELHRPARTWWPAAAAITAAALLLALALVLQRRR
jgi:hypothetical protein